MPNSVRINDSSETELFTASNPGQVTTAAGGATTPTSVNVTLTTANTQYSSALPSGCQYFEFHARTAAAVRFAFVTGKVATPTAPYSTLKANDYYTSPPANLTGTTLYLATASAGTIVELITWS